MTEGKQKMLIVALLVFCVLAYFAPAALFLTIFFASPCILIIGLYLLMTAGDRMFMEYFAELQEVYPKGALYSGSTRISSINEAFQAHFTMDDIAREIEDHGAFIAFKVGRRFLVFWKIEADGFSRV